MECQKLKLIINFAINTQFQQQQQKVRQKKRLNKKKKEK